ncbi:MAG TPA: protoporphyrinogen oxidase [Kofleriaceae bacterium]
MRVAVIGGGIGGLTAARALVAAGFDAQVLEAGDHPGGVLGTTRVDGFLREHAASSFLGGPSRGALALCEQLGVPVDKASARAKNRWIFIDGKARTLPRGPFDLVRSDLLTWRGKLALLREPFAPRRAQGHDESVHAFAARRLGAEAARAIMAPFVTGIFAADSHDISLEAGFPKLAELDASGGLVRGAAKLAAKGLLAKVTGKPTAKTPRGMWAPTGGLGSLVEALARELGSRIRTSSRVHTLAPADKSVLVNGERWDAAVLALPAHEAATLAAAAMPELATKLRGFHRAPVALVYLGVDARTVPRAADGFGCLVAQGEDPRVLGIVFESTVWPNRAPDGQVLLRCIFGGGRDPSAAALPDSELIELARHDANILLDADIEPTHATVIKWQHGIAQYDVGHRDHVREAVSAGRSQRIALAGADYRGAGVNDICADADVVVAELRTWT